MSRGYYNLTNGTVISEERALETASIDMLGSYGKIVTDKENTTIINGEGNSDSINKS